MCSPIIPSPVAAQDKGEAGQIPSVLGGWVGTYTCPQGLTGLTLSINAEEQGPRGVTFSGFFHFYPLASNARAREGCYSIRGRIGGDRRVVVEAVRWMTQPEGYVTVDLAGHIDGVDKTITGNVLAPGDVGATCTTFELKARVPAPRIALFCHAGIARAASAEQ